MGIFKRKEYYMEGGNDSSDGEPVMTTN